MNNLTEENPESFVLVVFDGVNSVNIKHMGTNGVSPLQLLALAEYLNVLARRELVTQINDRLEVQQQQQLSVPNKRIVVPGR